MNAAKVKLLIELSLINVSVGLVPVLVATVIYGKMVNDWHSVLLAAARMFIQLLLIGYALTAIFNLHHPLWVMLVILCMSLGAGWIALRPMKKYKQPKWPVFLSVLIAGGLNLFWILAFVIQPEPWFAPSVVIPLTGMVMANAMNSVSLCAERFWSEMSQENTYQFSIHTAMTAALIPQINALMAVGLVSLPGMMTGQILSGVSPLIAVRYQIVIMAMLISTASIGSFLYLTLVKKK